jgi:transcriptional regulator with XRE-family HTH domain
VANKKQPNPIDVHVGSRVRMKRMMLGMSQEKLGEQLGITFQQIQKYEKGANRIGASRLQQIARIFNVPVGYFFENAPGSVDREPSAAGIAEDGAQSYSAMDNFLSTQEGIQLNSAFMRIKDPQLRRRVIDLVRSMSTNSDLAAADKSE